MIANFKVLSLTDRAADQIKAIMAQADKPWRACASACATAAAPA